MALTVVVVLALTACDDAEPITGTPKDIVQHAQRAAASSEGYRITITGHNFVLPE